MAESLEYEGEKFRVTFRLTHQAAIFVHDHIRDLLQTERRRQNGITTWEKLLIALRLD